MRHSSRSNIRLRRHKSRKPSQKSVGGVRLMSSIKDFDRITAPGEDTVYLESPQVLFDKNTSFKKSRTRLQSPLDTFDEVIDMYPIQRPQQQHACILPIYPLIAFGFNTQTKMYAFINIVIGQQQVTYELWEQYATVRHKSSLPFKREDNDTSPYVFTLEDHINDRYKRKSFTSSLTQIFATCSRYINWETLVFSLAKSNYHKYRFVKAMLSKNNKYRLDVDFHTYGSSVLGDRTVFGASLDEEGKPLRILTLKYIANAQPTQPGMQPQMQQQPPHQQPPQPGMQPQIHQQHQQNQQPPHQQPPQQQYQQPMQQQGRTQPIVVTLENPNNNEQCFTTQGSPTIRWVHDGTSTHAYIYTIEATQCTKLKGVSLKNKASKKPTILYAVYLSNTQDSCRLYLKFDDKCYMFYPQSSCRNHDQTTLKLTTLKNMQTDEMRTSTALSSFDWGWKTEGYIAIKFNEAQTATNFKQFFDHHKPKHIAGKRNRAYRRRNSYRRTRVRSNTATRRIRKQRGH